MNSNLKLLPAALTVAMLALAGCGGGSSDDMMPDPTPPTPQELCEDAGNNWHEGDCYTDQELIDLGIEQGREAEAEESAKAAAAKAALAHHSLLGTDAGVPAIQTAATNPTPLTTKAADKSSQSLRLRGAKFSTLGLTAASTPSELVGFYPVATEFLGQTEADAFGKISQKTHTGNATTGDLNDFVTAGTYRGVSGMLRCDAGTTGCTSKDGNPVGANWHFKPNNSEDRIAGLKLDWGWWLTRDVGGNITVVNRFRTSDVTRDGLAASTGLEELGSGTASYEGDANGQYAVIGDSGAFEAKASLEATFGQAAIPLSGSIHTFTGADGESRDWMVELKAIADSGATGNGVYTGGTTVWNGNNLASGWSADMYNGTANAAPDAIVGGFEAESQGGRMTGMFGAALQE